LTISGQAFRISTSFCRSVRQAASAENGDPVYWITMQTKTRNGDKLMFLYESHCCRGRPRLGRRSQGRQGQSSGRLSDAQLARLYKKAEAAGMTKERTNARIVEKYKKQDPATLTRQEYDEICTSLDNAAAQHNQQGGNA